jgi:hypothetical protein
VAWDLFELVHFEAFLKRTISAGGSDGATAKQQIVDARKNISQAAAALRKRMGLK